MREDRVLRYFLDVLEAGSPANLPHPLALYYDLNAEEVAEIVSRGQKLYGYETKQQRGRSA